MKFTRIWLVVALVFLGSSLLAMDLMKGAKKYTPENPTGKSSAKSKISWLEPSRSGATLENGTAYVRVNTALNIRTKPWGKIVGTFKNNAKVSIIGRSGNWYKISLNGKTRYIHSRYVAGAKGESSPSYDTSASASTGSTQKRIVQACHDVAAKYSSYKSFPYDPLTEGGNLGCAQVVTHTLRQAGVNIPIILGVDNTSRKLQTMGWNKAQVPPYRQGDVIIWNPSHIGIIAENGNSVQAFNNSSSRRAPRFCNHDFMNIRYVLRKA
jgi:hypothetical protein